MSTLDTLMSSIAAPVTTSGAKVSLVGVGQVGMAAAFSILQQVIDVYFCTQVFINTQWQGVNAKIYIL